ncbi:MAG: hypothetical protein ACAI43_05775 [Phycisphaerae bacterium]|nr:hypothetical protein [Tepidisphaeraceae bacterium]
MSHRPRWFIPVGLWLIPLLGVGGPLFHLSTNLTSPDGYDGAARAPGAAWWACVLGSPAVTLLIAFATGRTFSFLTGASLVLLITCVALWTRSMRREEAIAYCHNNPTGGRTYVGFFSAGGGFAVSWGTRPFWVLAGFMFPPGFNHPGTASNPGLFRYAHADDDPPQYLGTFRLDGPDIGTDVQRRGAFTFIYRPPSPRDSRFVLVTPYWAPCLAFALLPAVWVARRIVGRGRRDRATVLCSACGYDLRATPERCPECGRHA